MMKKRTLGTALMLMVLMTQAVVSASSCITYTIRDEKAVLSAAENTGAYAEIPEMFSDMEVAGVGVNAFKDNEQLEGITLPETIEFIEWGAFENCINLKDINIPEKVTMIEDMTFAGCTSLETVSLPENLQAVGVMAFAETAVKEIIIPEGVAAIDIKAFENCAELEMVTLPESVMYIGEDAFAGCEKLTVKCVKGSYPEEYLKENNIRYIAE